MEYKVPYFWTPTKIIAEILPEQRQPAQVQDNKMMMEEWKNILQEKLHEEFSFQMSTFRHLIEIRDLDIKKLKIRCTRLEKKSQNSPRNQKANITKNFCSPHVYFSNCLSSFV